MSVDKTAGHKDILKEVVGITDSIIAHMTKKAPDMLWMFDVQKAYWDEAANAHDRGEKLLWAGACSPTELLYAFDCGQFLLDMIPTRLASQGDMAHGYIDLAEKHIPSSICGIDKVILGAILAGDVPEKPDAFVYSTVPCDSSRVVYPYVDKLINVPSYVIDVPFRKDMESYRYLAKQYEEVCEFMEDFTHQKLDWEKFVKIMEISNKNCILMKKIGDLRKCVPCPLPSRLTVLNEMIPCFVGREAMTEFLEKQYEDGKALAEKGIGCVPEERFRVSWLQNMLWSNVGILDWMEKKYGAVMVMDGFGYQETFTFNNPYDREDVFLTMAKKALALPMIHGAAGPIEDYVHLVDNIMDKYHVNVSMYVGHVGCKHTWAAAKVVTDMVQEKYGLPTLRLDVDAIDGRYKPTDEIKEIIREYMDTIIANQSKTA
jgi:benzoyl-CoA reductase/2-hydroxyglutaryl-CoA dehydratase subunit BcrC/BadD/HgdB